MYIDLLNNLAITTAVLFIAGRLFRNRSLLSASFITKITAGIGSGALGVMLMLSTIQVTDIVIVDLRHLAVVVAAAYGGLVASMIAGAIIGIMRIVLFAVNTASVSAAIIAIGAGLLFGLIAKMSVPRPYRFALMNVCYVTASSILIYSLAPAASINSTMLIYWLFSAIAGFFTYLVAEYIVKSNEDHRSILYYKLMAENSTDMISTHSLDGRFKYLSPSSVKIIGYAPEELIGSDPYDYYFPDDLDEIRKSHLTVTTVAKDYSVRYRFKRKDGTYTWLETASKRMMISAGADEEIFASPAILPSGRKSWTLSFARMRSCINCPSSTD